MKTNNMKNTITTITELIPSDSRKSFYRKAKVIEQKGSKYLLSYDTLMGSVDKDGKVHRYSGHDSNTTRRHVISFCRQFTSIFWQDFWKLPLEKKPLVKICL